MHAGAPLIRVRRQTRAGPGSMAPINQWGECPWAEWPRPGTWVGRCEIPSERTRWMLRRTGIGKLGRQATPRSSSGALAPDVVALRTHSRCVPLTSLRIASTNRPQISGPEIDHLCRASILAVPAADSGTHRNGLQNRHIHRRRPPWATHPTPHTGQVRSPYH